MKFEYELNYNFVNENYTFKVTKMPESLRCKGTIKKIDIEGTTIRIESVSYPELYSEAVFLRGANEGADDRVDNTTMSINSIIKLGKALKEFQRWVENEYEEPKVEMTVAEIEEKLGIKNLKIVKES